MEYYFFIDKNGQQQGPVPANELPRNGVTQFYSSKFFMGRE
jgi:hypothetical protein